MRPLLVIGPDNKVRAAYRDEKSGKVVTLPDSDAKTVQDTYDRFRLTIARLKEASERLSNNVVDIRSRKK